MLFAPFLQLHSMCVPQTFVPYFPFVFSYRLVKLLLNAAVSPPPLVVHRKADVYVAVQFRYGNCRSQLQTQLRAMCYCSAYKVY